jgi:hypothetical protein
VRLGFLVRVLALFHGGLEVLDAFAEAFAEVSQFARTKDEQRDGKDDKNFGQSEFPTHNQPPLGIAQRIESIANRGLEMPLQVILGQGQGRVKRGFG